MNDYSFLLGAVLALALLCYIVIRNRLVRRKNQVENAFGSIDAALKKRLDLVPNLVAAVKQYMGHERDLFDRIAALRAQVQAAPAAAAERLEAEGRLSRALSGLMVAVEQYPELKANQNVLQLQAALNEVEEQISAARRFYNTAVTDYNNAVETFPTNLVASSLGFERRGVFEIPESDRQAPNVGQLFQP